MQVTGKPKSFHALHVQPPDDGRTIFKRAAHYVECKHSGVDGAGSLAWGLRCHGCDSLQSLEVVLAKLHSAPTVTDSSLETLLNISHRTGIRRSVRLWITDSRVVPRS